MASAHDVAAYILRAARGSMPVMKLQKLVYYSQAWSLVWDDAPLFPERIEAWVNGPVVPSLYDVHRGRYQVDSWPTGDPAALSPAQSETVDMVLGFYAKHNSQWLSDLTHSEQPWIDARRGLAPTQRGNAEITLESMAEYYGSLP
jgi:uncharacterized phage-associated protein